MRFAQTIRPRQSTKETGDLRLINALVVLAYLVATTLFGMYLARFVKKDDDFFLAGRSLNQWVVAGTIMAANVAAIYLVGPAAAAYGGAAVCRCFSSPGQAT